MRQTLPQLLRQRGQYRTLVGILRPRVLLERHLCLPRGPSAQMHSKDRPAMKRASLSQSDIIETYAVDRSRHVGRISKLGCYPKSSSIRVGIATRPLEGGVLGFVRKWRCLESRLRQIKISVSSELNLSGSPVVSLPRWSGFLGVSRWVNLS